MSNFNALYVGEYLSTFCVGKANAQTKHEIAEAMAANDIPIDERELHDCFRELIVDYQLPVCGRCCKPLGYYVATEADDKRAALKSLRGRALSIFQRRRALMRAPLWPKQSRERGLFDAAPADEVRAELERRRAGAAR